MNHRNTGKTKSILIKICRSSAVILAVVLIYKFLIPDLFIQNVVTTLFPEKQYIHDEAGILSEYKLKRFNQYLNYVFLESDIDIRLVFLENNGDKTIEEIATEKVQDLGIGGKSREERGVLLLYDLSNKKLRIELGYGLEPYFPDSFVGYLVHDHAHAFFSSGNISTGLHLLVRILHHRIREEKLGNNFDPRVIEIIRQGEFLSGGAGVTAVMPEKGGSTLSLAPIDKEDDLQRYSAQPTPKDSYIKWMQWLAEQRYNCNIDLFTPESQKYMASLPMTKAYFHYMLMYWYGRKYEIDVRDNLALLYFTDDPLITPLFFVKTDKGWQMDVVTEVRNTRNRVGGVYSWDYSGENDKFTKAFIDKFINIKNYVRIIGGDNRELPIRNSS